MFAQQTVLFYYYYNMSVYSLLYLWRVPRVNIICILYILLKYVTNDDEIRQRFRD